MSKEHACPNCGHTGYRIYSPRTGGDECVLCSHDFGSGTRRESKKTVIAMGENAIDTVNFLSRSTHRTFEECQPKWLMQNAGKAPRIGVDYKALVDWGGSGIGPTETEVANHMTQQGSYTFEEAYTHLIAPKMAPYAKTCALINQNGIW